MHFAVVSRPLGCEFRGLDPPVRPYSISKDEESHIDWLEGLHAISEMGLQNYLAQQLHETEK